MFSRAERAFLESIASEGRAADRPPGPVGISDGYRRKLIWGIRRKASRSYSDWALYTAAVRKEVRLLPLEPVATPPVHVDPVATIFDEFHRRLRRLARPTPPTPRRPPGGA
jgi:hypothetical protein